MWGVGDKKVPVGDVGVLLKVEHDVVGGVLLVDDAESEVGSLGALWGRLNVTLSVSGVAVGRGMVGVAGRGMGGGASEPNTKRPAVSRLEDIVLNIRVICSPRLSS